MLNKLINKKNKSSESGFTIIEVLIVLAIAGLILVVVLIAIPQLQRNQRNTSRQNDAARTATSVSNWVANNNGAAVTAASLPNIRTDIGELNQYTTAQITLAAGAQAAVVTLDNVRIVTGATCGLNGVTVAGTLRQFAVQYGIETSGTPVGGCLDV